MASYLYLRDFSDWLDCRVAALAPPRVSAAPPISLWISAMTPGGGLFGVAYRLLVELPKHAVGHLAVNEDHLEGAELLIIHIDGFVAAMLDRDGIAPFLPDHGLRITRLNAVYPRRDFREFDDLVRLRL